MSRRRIPGTGGHPVTAAMVLSLLAHGAAGIGATHLALDPAGARAGRVMAWSSGAAVPSLLVEWAPPAPADELSRDRPEAPPAPWPEPPPPELASVPPPPEPPLRLGLEESDQKSRNVMGFNDPTPHAAPEVGVDQPALDPTAGATLPGGPMAPTAGGMAEPVAAPEGERPEAEVTAEFGPPAPPDSSELASPMVPLAETPPLPPQPPLEAQTAAPKGDGPESQPARPEVVAGRPEELLSPTPLESGPVPGEAKLPEPAQAERRAGEEVDDPADGLDVETVEPAPAGAPPAPDAAATPERPNERPDPAIPSPPGPQGPPAPAAAPSPPAAPGEAPTVDPVLGAMAGIRSEKEADAGSRKNPLEIQLGRPAAGQGLEIITKRPSWRLFSTYTRTTASPGNPVIDVRFGRDGRVNFAKVVQSSGVSDVDSPLIAAVYTWTARGKRLETIPRNDPNAGITVTVTIMIR